MRYFSTGSQNWPKIILEFLVIFFFKVAEKLLRPCGIEIKARDKNWIVEKKMEAFLSVAKGSVESPVFLEIKYNRNKKEENPIVLVGLY